MRLAVHGAPRARRHAAGRQPRLLARHPGDPRGGAAGALRLQGRCAGTGRCSAAWSAGAGTLYIERERKRDALRVVHQMAEALRAGDTVAVFPEGTTGDGRDAAAVPRQPAAGGDRHRDAGAAGGAALLPTRSSAVSPAAEFVGDTTLAQSLWRDRLRARACACSVQCPAGRRRAAHADRRALAGARCATTIAAARWTARALRPRPQALALARHRRGGLGRRFGVAEVVAADRLQVARRVRRPAGCRSGCSGRRCRRRRCRRGT